MLTFRLGLDSSRLPLEQSVNSTPIPVTTLLTQTRDLLLGQLDLLSRFAVFEDCEARVHNMTPGYGSDLGKHGLIGCQLARVLVNPATHRFLVRQHLVDFHIPDFWQHRTLHDRSSLIVLDVPHPLFPLKADLFCEPLFLEVSHCVVVCIGEKMVDGRVSFPHMVFERVHQMGSVSL